MNPISRTPRTDLHVESSSPRPTPRSGANFRELLARSASSLVQGAQSAVTQMPGGAVLAAAVRGASGSVGGGPALGGSPAAPALAGPAPGAAPANPLAPPTSTPIAPPGGAKGGDTTNAPAEGPSAAGSAPGGAGTSVENMMQSSAEMNLYYLQLQEAMSSENRVYSAQSNVMKARHDTVKNAIGNIR